VSELRAHDHWDKKMPQLSRARNARKQSKRLTCETSSLRTQNEGDGRKREDMTTLWGKTRCLRHHPKGSMEKKKKLDNKCLCVIFGTLLVMSLDPFFLLVQLSYTSFNYA
jgi:hypothetical protein